MTSDATTTTAAPDGTTTTGPGATTTTAADVVDLSAYECPTPAEVSALMGFAEADLPLQSEEGERDDGADQGVVTVCR